MVRCYCCAILCVLILMISSCGYSMNSLPEGELLETYYSPNEQYVLRIYLVDGGATVDYAIRGELTDTDTGEIKNIYWNYHENEATVIWQDDYTVIINDHTLNLPNDVYDFRAH